MSALLFGRGGTYRLRWRHELDARAGEASEVRVLLADEASALAFARRLAEGPDGQARLRALLAGELGRIHQLDDSEVIRQLAVRLASKRLLAVRVQEAPLHTFDVHEGEAPPPLSQETPKAEPKTWIAIELVDEEGKPVANERYWILLPDGSVREGRLDTQGRAHVGDLDPGECDVRFPDLDNDAVASPGEPARPRGRVLPKRPKKTWVEIELIGMDGTPIPDERYRIELATGEVHEGVLDGRGRARVDGIDPGTAKVTFPALDGEAWEPV